MQKDREQAASYRQAAYSGDTKAMNNLGVCYMRGAGVQRKARHRLQQGA